MYRCYFLDEESRIFERQDFEANSDAEAIAIARTFSWEHKPRRFEIWEGTRYLHGEDCTTDRYIGTARSRRDDPS